MTHVVDDLELYALDALPAADRARITAHLAECPACREQARLLEEVAVELPDTLPQQEVPARLRSRILASARADLAAPAARRGTAWTAWLSPTRLALAGLVAAVLVLGTVDLALMRQRDEALAQRDSYGAVVARVAHGGKSWYMAGLDRWAGSGGTLFAPAKPDLSPYIVFHDLRPLDAGTVYALWLVDPDGHWVRAANFRPTGDTAQAVILDEPVSGYTQCAVTVETAREGRRAGPLVMQSRIGPPAQ
ncbi:MAG TPA: anti-sigma factor [Candidatus Limnocylindria bacterium]|nr:anti-sigma factor [Candidatus Limnocylindria bacterium]